jgi:hypothetical protein
MDGLDWLIEVTIFIGSEILENFGLVDWGGE